MLRRLLPLGAVALTACHLVAGLDDYTLGASSGTETTAGPGGNGGASVTSVGGAGGAGGGMVDPVRMLTDFGKNLSTAKGPVVALGEQAMVGGLVDAPVTLPGLSASSPKSALPGNYFGALFDEPSATPPSIANSFWSRDTEAGAVSAPIEVASASDGKTVWLAAATRKDSEEMYEVVVHSSAATSFQVAVSASAPSNLDFFDLALAATPDGSKLYAAHSFYSGTFDNVRITRLAVGADGALTSELVFTLGSVSGFHHLRGLVATDTALYVATTCRGDQFDMSSQSIAENVCVAAIPHDADPPKDGLAFTRRIGCNIDGKNTRALAMAASGSKVYLALESTCEKLDTTVGVANYKPTLDGAEPKSFGIYSFDEATVLGMAQETNGFKKVAGYTSPISRAATSPVVLAPYVAEAGPVLLVGGTFDSALKVGSEMLRTTKTASPQAFVVGLAPDLSLPSASPMIFTTDGPGSAGVTSMAARAGGVWMAGERTGGLQIGDHSLPGGSPDKVAFVLSATDALFSGSTP